MSRTTLQKNNLATAYGTSAAKASLHTADPAGTGTNEVTGGSPAYAKKTITWGSPAAGLITATVIFDVPAGTTVRGAGVWDASNNYLDGGVVADQAFGSQGQYTLSLSYQQN